VFAFDKRDEARDQRREAEGLVGFMLGDLRQKLEPIGELDSLDAVGSRALAYFSKQDETELSDAALAQRSRALSLMGEIAIARRDLPGAEARYKEAMRGTAEMIRRKPDDPQRLFDHAQNVFYFGQLATDLGKPEEAEARMREYKRLADRMVALEPGNAKWQTEVGYADTNLGMALFRQRRYGEASRQFANSVRTVEALAAADPRNREKQSAVAEGLAWLADSLNYDNRLSEAIAQRERQIKILDSLMAQSSDVDHRQRAIPALRALGRILASTGAMQEGLRHSRRAVEIAERLMPTEPSNMNWVELSAGARIDLGTILMVAGKQDEAAAEIRAACDLAQRLSSGSTDTPASRELAYQCVARRVELALARRSGDEAVGLAQQALSSAARIKGPDAERNQYALAVAHKLAGDALAASGDRAAAANQWRTALRIWPSSQWGPRPVKLKAGLLNSLGRVEEARQLERKLAAIGYKNAV
jgi:tetratricopeptide (TPR) repeat protein